MAGRAPTLYRIGQIVAGIGTAVLVILIIFLATAAYSAAQLRPDVGQGGGSSSITLESNGTVMIHYAINLSNPGYYPISPLSISFELRNASLGVLAVGGSGAITIPAGSTTTIPVAIWIPLSGSAAALATHDAVLPTHVWLNATYASIFVVHLGGNLNTSWGAPFYNFSAAPGTPTVQSNGTVLVPVMVSFENHADFSDAGTIAFTVVSASGGTCAASSFPINVAPHGQFNQALSFYASPACNPSGGRI
ncbi:MAG: hypothetical protein L3K06_03040, partial [Thermoplasmata archaeon]|nr:hypothetical protein [Thermoplasmata archaeon]